MKMVPPELIHTSDDAGDENDSVSSYLPTPTTNKKEQDELLQMRVQLWDAYRLAYIVLGESIQGRGGGGGGGSGLDLENGTLLRAIRAVAEIKEELWHLNKCLDLCYQREKRHRQNFESKEVLRDKCQALEYQLTQQRLEYQELQASHLEYVQDTKGKLQALYLVHSQSRGAGVASAAATTTAGNNTSTPTSASAVLDSHQEQVVEDKEDPQETHHHQAYQELFLRVAKAASSVQQQQPLIDTLQAQLRASREDTRQTQQQLISQKEEMEYATHIETLETALKRAACQQQQQQGSSTRCSNNDASNAGGGAAGAGVTSEEIKEVLSKLQSMPLPTTTTASSFQKQQRAIQETILELLERLAANNPTRETVHYLEIQVAATTKKEKERAAQLEDLVSELKVVEWEKQMGQKELQTTEAWYQEKLHASMASQQERQAEIQELDAQLDELAVVALQVEDLESELQTSRQQYETELEQTRLREQASSKKAVELEAQLKKVMEDQQRSLLKSAAAAAKNEMEPKEATTKEMDELRLQVKDAISRSDKDHSPPPCLTPTDTDSSYDFSSTGGYSYSEDDYAASPTKKKLLFKNDKRDAVVKEGAPRLWVPQPALNNDKELRETQEQLMRSQRRIAELERRVHVGRQKGGNASTSTQSTGGSSWFSLDPSSGSSGRTRHGRLFGTLGSSSP